MYIYIYIIRPKICSNMNIKMYVFVKDVFFLLYLSSHTGSLRSVSSSAHKLCQAWLLSWILITLCDVSLICWTADVGRWVLVMGLSFSDYMLDLWSQLHIFHCMWPSRFIGTYMNVLLILQKVCRGRIEFFLKLLSREVCMQCCLRIWTKWGIF